MLTDMPDMEAPQEIPLTDNEHQLLNARLGEIMQLKVKLADLDLQRAVLESNIAQLRNALFTADGKLQENIGIVARGHGVPENTQVKINMDKKAIEVHG